METLASFFPLHSSPSKESDIIDLATLLESIFPGDKLLTNESSRKLSHYLMMIMWSFIVETRLFKVKPEYEHVKKLLRKYCIDRNVQFSQQFFNNELFFKQDMELLNDSQLIDKSDEYDGQKKIKLEDCQYSLEEYFDQLTEKFLPGEVKRYAVMDAKKGLKNLKNSEAVKTTIRIDKLQSLVLKYFEYDSSLLKEENRDEKLYFTAIGLVLEYLAAEILEPSRNLAMDLSSPFISHSFMQNIIYSDIELRETIFNCMNMIPMVDFNYFYGSNQEIPQITQTNYRPDEISFCNIPSELHSLFLQHFDSLETLLNMRLVCKQWNHFIMNDNLIWKQLTLNSLISEGIFKHCDSTFTIQELDQILERGKHVKPLSVNQQIINYFHDKKDWKTLYFILVQQHLKFIRDVDEMYSNNGFEKYFQNEFRGNNGYSSYENLFNASKKRILVGVTGGKNMDDSIFQTIETDTVLIPKDQFEVFSKIDSEMVLVALIDFSQYSCFISCRKFPQHGLLYCFHNHEDNKSEFLYYEKLNLNSESCLIPFQLTEDTFKRGKPVFTNLVNQEQIVVNMDGPSSIYYLQNSFAQTSFSSLAPCYELSFNDDRERINLDIYNEDRVTLYSDKILDEKLDQFSTFCISISVNDLERRDFTKGHIDSYEWY